MRPGALVALLAAVLSGGCHRDPGQPPASTISPPLTGFVSVARLMAEHRLYPSLSRLDREIADLSATRLAGPTGSPQWPALPPALPFPLESPFFPLGELAREVALWREMVAERPWEPATDLPADLRIRLELARRQLDSEADYKLNQAISELQKQVTQTRAAAVRARQEALNNAELDLSKADLDAAEAARQLRASLWAEVEAETARAREAADAELQRLQNELQQGRHDQWDSIQQELLAEFRRRMEITAKSGSKTRAEMSKALSKLELPVVQGELIYQTALPKLATTTPAAGLQTAAAERIGQQLQRLRAQRHQLARSIYDATEAAVAAVALQNDMELLTQPDDRAAHDYTETVRPLVREILQP